MALGRRDACLVCLGGLAFYLAVPPLRAATPGIYVAENGQTLGPFDEEALKQRIRSQAEAAQTLVWHQGLADWTPASQVPELAAFVAALPVETPFDSAAFIVGTWRATDAVLKHENGVLFAHETLVFSADGNFRASLYAEYINVFTSTVPSMPGGIPMPVLTDLSVRYHIDGSGTYITESNQDGTFELSMKGEETFATLSAGEQPERRTYKVDFRETMTVLGPDHMRSGSDENYRRQIG